jgi:hypothetical protein
MLYRNIRRENSPKASPEGYERVVDIDMCTDVVRKDGCFSSGEIKKEIWSIVKLKLDSKIRGGVTMVEC